MKVLILSTTDDFGLNLLRCLASQDFERHVMGSGKLRGIQLSKYCKKYLTVDPIEFRHPTDKIIAQINGYCREQKIDLISASDEESTFLLSKIQAAIVSTVRVFPIDEPENLKLMNNKWLLARFLKENGLPFPKTALVETAEMLGSLKINFPLIVKPLDLGNKMGVKKLNSIKEAYGHISAGGRLCKLPLLFQEFIPGTDVDLNILADRGKVVAASIQEWRSESEIAFIDHEGILDIGRKIVAASRYHGLAHFDMRLDSRDGSIKVIECNPRFWGSMRASMWNGINFVECGIQLAQGRTLPKEFPNRHIVYRLPSKILSEFMRGHFSILKDIPEASRRDLWQLVSDPLSCLYMASIRFFNR